MKTKSVDKIQKPKVDNYRCERLLFILYLLIQNSLKKYMCIFKTVKYSVLDC